MRAFFANMFGRGFSTGGFVGGPRHDESGTRQFGATLPPPPPPSGQTIVGIYAAHRAACARDAIAFELQQEAERVQESRATQALVAMIAQAVVKALADKGEAERTLWARAIAEAHARDIEQERTADVAVLQAMMGKVVRP